MSSVQETNLKAIADAIRAKEKSTGTIKASTFPQRISAIQTGVSTRLIVTTMAGASVTATKDSITVSGTAGTDGTCTLVFPEAGEWRVTAAKGNVSKTQSIVIGTQNLSISLGDPIFANNDWSTIIAACQSGTVPDTWSVGDNKNMTIGGTSYQIDIIGKNHDDYADGSGKAPLTFQLHDCYSETKDMVNTESTVFNWTTSKMRTIYLPSIQAHMPTEVQNSIRKVTKTNWNGATDGSSSGPYSVEDTLFLLSEFEIFGLNTHSNADDDAQYDYYKAGNSTVKKVNADAVTWWERSIRKGQSGCMCIVNKEGISSFIRIMADDLRGVSFAFCF